MSIPMKVSMTLSSKTIRSVERIQALSQTKTKATVVARGIKLLEWTIDEVNHGSTILIQKKNGEQEQITISGI